MPDVGCGRLFAQGSNHQGVRRTSASQTRKTMVAREYWQRCHSGSRLFRETERVRGMMWLRWLRWDWQRVAVSGTFELIGKRGVGGGKPSAAFEDCRGWNTAERCCAWKYR